jgi:tetratricopeptide (TPR) repeat protein
MSRGLIELRGEDVFCTMAGGEAETRLPHAAVADRLAGWAGDYALAADRDRDDELTRIGREMFAWLNEDSETGWASRWADEAGDRELEIRVTRREDARGNALLNAPWELLARASGPLALDAIQPFIVIRRLGAPAPAPWEPHHHDLQLMFMAAAPAGQVDLDYEREEAVVLDATRGDGRVHVVVEETGALDFLGGRLASEEGPFEAVHLSCHGAIDQTLGPVLLLETAEGDAAPVGPGAVVQALGAPPPPLLVLSACHTAESGRTDATTGVGRREAGTQAGTERDAARRAGNAGAAVSASFVRQLTAQVANVVGWDGSVYDQDATDFAQAFYGALGRGAAVPRAAALARQVLLQQHGTDPQRGRHWHLARVYLGPQGGGPLCAPGKPRRRNPGQVLERAFLDEKRQHVPVATRAAFVGRRRAIQTVLRAFRDQAGVLVHGMGALGKSSLAARVASRMRHRPVVIFERYDALAIFDAVAEALDPRERRAERSAWRELVKSDPASLAEALESWLGGPLDAAPILLIIDDLERVLEPPAPEDAGTGVMVTEAYRPVLAAVLRAFARVQTSSRLLLTSRYVCRLPDGAGGDLAAALHRVPLTPMPERERRKQLRAAERLAGREGEAGEAAPLLERALAAAAGNPGLQAILTRPILAGEVAAAETALGQITAYRAQGVPPAEIQALIEAGTAQDSANALVLFFARLSFASYRAALSGDQAHQLAAATLFVAEAPIPLAALAAAGAALGVENATTAVSRLLALGLLDDFGEIEGIAHAAVNPLARPLAAALDAADRPRLAGAALPSLVAAWGAADGDFPGDIRGVAAAELALAAGASADLTEAAVFAGAAWLERVRRETRAALALIERGLNAFSPDHAADPGFLRLGAECADGLGEAALQDRLLGFPTRPPRPGDPASAAPHAALDLRRAERFRRTGAVERAEALTREALVTFRAAKDERMSAMAAGQIADILQARGELDEALRIRREEQLPVYDRLGEVRERAVTMGRIADILAARGELDEALRIRREEQLPVFDRLGDVRERAVTMGQIADILAARGELDEALRVRREEELPVYDRLGEVRERGVTLQKIAAALMTAGGLEHGRIQEIFEALAEAFSIARRLGIPDGIAGVGAQLAQVLALAGHRDEALAVLDKAEAGFQKLGHAEGLAHVGQLREAIRSRQQ